MGYYLKLLVSFSLLFGPVSCGNCLLINRVDLDDVFMNKWKHNCSLMFLYFCFRIKGYEADSFVVPKKEHESKIFSINFIEINFPLTLYNQFRILHTCDSHSKLNWSEIQFLWLLSHLKFNSIKILGGLAQFFQHQFLHFRNCIATQYEKEHAVRSCLNLSNCSFSTTSSPKWIDLSSNKMTLE